MRCVFTSVVPVATLLLLTACSGTQSTVAEAYRLDLGPGMVAAFVEGLTPEMP